MDVLRQWRRRRALRRHGIADHLWQEAVAAHAVLRALPASERGTLRDLATLFLAEKDLFEAGGCRLTPLRRVRIAALACLPILSIGPDAYAGWRSLVIYPGEFVSPRETFDDAGVLHEWREVLSGEAWEQGPVVLAWTDIEASGQRDGYNVIVHEMAHKLDMLNGDTNGFPPLHRDMAPGAWSEAFGAAYRALVTAVEAGSETGIDPYAVENPGEFFAVCSEYFFDQPEVLATEFPAVYGQLKAFFRLDPLGWSAAC